MQSIYEGRKHLTFEQAEGAAPIPAQLQPKEISRELRARLFEAIYLSIKTNSPYGHLHEQQFRQLPHGGAWQQVAYEKFVYRDHKAADAFDPSSGTLINELKIIIFKENYLLVFGTIEWILRTGKAPPDLAPAIEGALRASRAAYRVFDQDTIVPVASETEAETLEGAFADISAAEFGGARAHMREAGSKLTSGDYPGSIRDSIHAVEAVAKVLEPGSKTLGPALTKLEQSVRIHGALRAGFSSLYGFTNDEKGIRHALLDLPAAQVDETDALYMLGSCAAFVSYLINKARAANVLT